MRYTIGNEANPEEEIISSATAPPIATLLKVVVPASFTKVVSHFPDKFTI